MCIRDRILSGPVDDFFSIFWVVPSDITANAASNTPPNIKINGSLANHAADNAASGISGRVTGVIILSGVDHDRRTARMKD